MALKKLAREAFWTEVNLRPQQPAVEESLSAENALLERLVRDIAAEADKIQQLFVKRLEASQTASRQLSQNEEFIQKLQARAAAAMVELRKCRKLATGTTEEL